MRDVKRPHLVRLAGLQVLVSYVDSTSWVSLDDLENPPRFALLGSVADRPETAVSTPLAASSRQVILAVLAELAASDVDVKVRQAAQYIQRGL